jgi:hypothetical protein
MLSHDEGVEPPSAERVQGVSRVMGELPWRESERRREQDRGAVKVQSEGLTEPTELRLQLGAHEQGEAEPIRPEGGAKVLDVVW